MTTTATHHEHATTAARVLFMACELSEKTWQRVPLRHFLVDGLAL